MFPDWQALAYTNLVTQLLTTVYCHFVFLAYDQVLFTEWWFYSVVVGNVEGRDRIFFFTDT